MTLYIEISKYLLTPRVNPHKYVTEAVQRTGVLSQRGTQRSPDNQRSIWFGASLHTFKPSGLHRTPSWNWLPLDIVSRWGTGGSPEALFVMGPLTPMQCNKEQQHTSGEHWRKTVESSRPGNINYNAPMVGCVYPGKSGCRCLKIPEHLG